MQEQLFLFASRLLQHTMLFINDVIFFGRGSEGEGCSKNGCIGVILENYASLVPIGVRRGYEGMNQGNYVLKLISQAWRHLKNCP